MSPEREFHDVANIFPLMTNDEFQELCDDIKKNDLMSPIVLIDEKILDGRNRYRACLHLDIEPEYVVYTGSDPISYAISANLKRRHLTVGQLTMIAEKALPLFKAEAERRRRGTWAKPGEQAHRRATESSSGVTDSSPYPQKPVENAKKRSGTSAAVDLAGKAVGVSGKSVQRYRKLKKTASPETLAAFESGEISLGEAAAMSDGKKPEPSRQKLLKELNATVGKCVRLVHRIGVNDAKGAKAYKLLDEFCKLLANWTSGEGRHIQGDRVCYYLLNSGKVGAVERFQDDPIFAECVSKLPQTVAKYPDIGRAVETAAKSGFRSQHFIKNRPQKPSPVPL